MKLTSIQKTRVIDTFNKAINQLEQGLDWPSFICNIIKDVSIAKEYFTVNRPTPELHTRFYWKNSFIKEDHPFRSTVYSDTHGPWWGGPKARKSNMERIEFLKYLIKQLKLKT